MKKFKVLLMVLVCMAGLIYPGNVKVDAASKAYVLSNSDMLNTKDGLLYEKDAENGNSSIYQFTDSTGNSSKVVSEANGILNYIKYGSTIYYTTSDSNRNWITKSVSLTGKNKKKQVTGIVIYADSSYIVYETAGTTKTTVYTKNLSSGKITKIAETKDALSFIKNIGDTLYFYKYESTVNRIKLLSMKTNSSKMKLVTKDSCSKDDSYYSVLIPDIISHSGNLIYQYGSYQGTGMFWYGTMKKIDAKGKKTTVAKNVITDTIPFNSTKIFYSIDAEKNSNQIYTVKTGTKKSYKITAKEGQYFDILGSNTYRVDVSDTKMTYVSRFTSGTDRTNLKKNFIKISYKQNKKYTYSGEVRKVGSNYVVGITATDFSDQAYGWRGRLVATTWYVANSSGKVIGSFK